VVFYLRIQMRGRARALIESTPDQFAADATAVTFDDAFTLHHRAVFSTARAVLRDSALAEDVTQEVFLKLHRHPDAARDGELLRPWLLRVTINLARNAVRGQSRSMARDTAYQKTSDDSVALLPHEDYESRLELQGVRRALNKIKEPMRSCLLLKQQGLSYREIAQTLSLKETNVGSLVARGRKEFARTYGKIGASQ
jgi:RNA polymerase sigma factor (sigma-70 family)